MEWKIQLGTGNLGEACTYVQYSWSRMAPVHLLHQRLWKITAGVACSRILGASISEMGESVKEFTLWPIGFISACEREN